MALKKDESGFIPSALYDQTILLQGNGGFQEAEYTKENRLSKRYIEKLKKKLDLKLNLIALLKRTRGCFPSGMT